MLKDEDPTHQGRACAALPALCGIKSLRKKLLKDDLIDRVLELCRTADNREVQLIAMKTLSYLVQHFGETSRILLRRPDFIKEILVMLKDKSAAVVVAALKVLTAVNKNIPKYTLTENIRVEIVKRLKRLTKRRDFFVTPASVAALCEICQDDKFRKVAIESGILVTLIDLFEFDKRGLSGGPRGLTKLAEFGDVRSELARGLLIDRLIAFSRDKAVEKSNEATDELTKLSKHAELRKKIIDKGGLDSIVNNLTKRDHALFAADALLNLMKYDDAREWILNTEVDLHLLRMINERIFDGTIGREGMDILEEIFQNEHLRPIMLQPDNEPSLCNGSWNFDGKNAPKRLFKKATNYVLDKTIRRLVRKPTEYSDKPEYPRNVIGILRKMLETTQLDSVQKSAINYLRIIADYDDAREKMIGAGIIEPLLWCLKAPGLDNQALKDILEKIARHKTLRGEITQNSKILAEMLSSNYPVEIIRMRETFKSLSSYSKSSPNSEIQS
ncbi:armadillo-type protein [Suillus spraguei]|nr:armadillo-type protein [Suillus spraguei]